MCRIADLVAGGAQRQRRHAAAECMDARGPFLRTGPVICLRAPYCEKKCGTSQCSIAAQSAPDHKVILRSARDHKVMLQSALHHKSMSPSAPCHNCRDRFAPAGLLVARRAACKPWRLNQVEVCGMMASDHACIQASIGGSPVFQKCPHRTENDGPPFRLPVAPEREAPSESGPAMKTSFYCSRRL